MKASLSLYLALSYLAVIGIGVAAAAPLAWQIAEQWYVEAQQANLLAQAQLAAAALQGVPLPPTASQPYSQTSNVSVGVHTRLLTPQGAVWIDANAFGGSEIPLLLPPLTQNATGDVSPAELLRRPEIAQALSGQPATAVRNLDLPGRPRLVYAAAPIVAADGGVLSIVYLASPLPRPSLGALPGAARGQVLGLAVFGLLVAGASGLLLARRIVWPLQQLLGAAQAVAAGDLHQARPPASAIGEVDALGAAFAAMTSSLRQADQAKTAFVADVSHELRAPLTVIKGSIETLQDGALDDVEVRDTFLETMMQETERLIRLVNDLLILTRADAGALQLQIRPLDLAALGRARCQMWEALAADLDVRLEVLAGASVRRALADADRVAQVLDNLLSNALRHAPGQSTVTISITEQGGDVECRVCDQGVGIDPQHLPLIFERFYRADAARSRADGGSGLGLAIAKALVLAHGGEIWAENLRPQGASFGFRLPADL